MNFLKFKSFKILDIIDTLKFKKKKTQIEQHFLQVPNTFRQNRMAEEMYL